MSIAKALKNRTKFLFIGLAVYINLICFAWADSEPPFRLPKKSDLNRIRSALLSTDRGDIYFELFPELAPWHVANMKYLADKGFYRGLTFHIYRPGYIIQGGAPHGNESGGPGYSLPPEFNSLKHLAGSLGMARRQDIINPGRESSGSQFHILLSEAPHMDGSYTSFGRVIKGMDVVLKLRKRDQIKEFKVFLTENPSEIQ